MKTILFGAMTLIAGVCHAANLTQLDPDKLASLDSAPELVKHLADDRMSKTLIRQSNLNSGQLITTHLLDKAIADVVESELATQAVVDDLASGDDNLRQTILQILAAFNVGPGDATGLVLGWAEAGDPSSLRAVLFNAIQRPEVMQRLRPYFLDNDLDWIRTTAALSALLSGQDEEISNALAIAISNATGNTLASTLATVKKAQEGDLSAKWLLNSNMTKVVSINGAMARVMLAQPLAGNSTYEKVWRRVAELIAADPLTVSEYAQRTYALTPLYDAICQILINSLVSDNTERFRRVGTALVKYSTIPASRFQWMSNEILGVGGADAFKRLRTDKEKNSALEKIVNRLAVLMQTDAAWCDMILWHLTRVGEAAVLSTRNALPQTIVENDALATDMIRAGAPFGSAFDSKLARAGAYSYYPGGGAELRTKVDSGEVEVTALRAYMKALATLLATDDDAWDMLFLDLQRDHGRFVARILSETIDRDTTASTAWIQTIQNNDEALKAGFVKWLVENKEANDTATANLWIESVASAVANGGIIGNTEVAKLKAAFVSFIGSEPGWALVTQRIAIESYGFPSLIRTMLINRAVSTPADFWPIYRKLANTKGATVSILRNSIINYVRASNLPGMILDETAAQNPYAADASAVIWDKMMAPGTPLVAEMERLLRDGFTMNLAYGVANLALIDVVRSEGGWPTVLPYAAAFFQVSPTANSLQQETIEALSTNSSNSVLLVQRLLSDSVIQGMWRERILALVKFLGKAPPVASVVRRESEIEKDWKVELSEKAATDTYLIESLVNALGMRRVGDSVFAGQVRGIREDLAKMVFYDRILFEQILADKNGEYRKELLDQVRDRFGTYVEQQWR